MSQSDVLWNEVARIINIEFLESGQPITGVLLVQLIKAVNEVLTDDDGSA